MTDILVRVGSPDALNNTLSMLPGAGGAQVVFDGGEAKVIDGCYIVRVDRAHAGFVEFAMRNQGYAEIVRVLIGNDG